MLSIKTYLSNGVSIVAQIDSEQLSIDYHNDLSCFDNHVKVARALAEKMGVELTAGYTSTKTGYKFAIKTGLNKNEFNNKN